MVQKQSWEGSLTRDYERLGLHGGYARKRYRNLPSSLENSEYVKDDGIVLYIVARGGKLIKPVKTEKEAHYNHSYSTYQQAEKLKKGFIKQYKDRMKGRK